MKQKTLEWLKTYGVYILLGFLVGSIYSVFNRSIYVHGSSMEPTYSNGDILSATKFWDELQCGDVIVLSSEYKEADKTLIKRIIGCPGDVIQITEGGEIIRNGEILSEEYIQEKIKLENRGIFTDIVLGVDEYFVLGDNRNNSIDSRIIGVIPEKNIEYLIRQ